MWTIVILYGDGAARRETAASEDAAREIISNARSSGMRYRSGFGGSYFWAPAARLYGPDGDPVDGWPYSI